MNAPREPVRWADSAEAPSELVAGIRALRAGRGSAGQVETLARRLAPQLAAPTVAGSGAWISTWLKGGALLLTALLGVYAFSRLGPPHATPRPPVQPAPVPEAAPAMAPVGPVAPAEPARVAVKARRPQAVDSNARAKPDPEAELALVQRSQTALDRDPSLALSLAKEHAQAYPNGIFAQEREILALEALLKLRQRPVALRRAEVFLQRFPDSPHSRRVRALLERSRVPGPATIPEGSAHPKDAPAPTGGGHDPN